MDEIQNLIIKVQGKQEIEALNNAVAKEEAAIRGATEAILKLQAAGQGGSAAAKKLEADMRLSADTILSHTARTKELQRSQVDLSRATQQAAYAVGDFMSTSGGWGQRLNSIANNVQFVGAQFGAMGIAIGLGVQALATGLTMYERRVKDAENAIGTSIKSLEKHIEQLEGKEIKLQVDYRDIDAAKEKLEDLQRGLKAFKAVGEMHTGYEKQSGQFVNTLLENTPGGPKALTAQLEGQFVVTDPEIARMRKEADELDAKVKQAEKTLEMLAQMGEDTTGAAAGIEGQKAEAAKKRSEIAERSTTGARGAVGDVLGKAQAGDQAAQAQLGGMLRGVGRGNMADMLAHNTAAKIAETEKAHAETMKSIRQNNEEISRARLKSQTDADEEAKAYNAGHPVGPRMVVKFHKWKDRYYAALDEQGWRRDEGGEWVKGGDIAIEANAMRVAGFNEGAPLGMPGAPLPIMAGPAGVAPVRAPAARARIAQQPIVVGRAALPAVGGRVIGGDTGTGFDVEGIPGMDVGDDMFPEIPQGRRRAPRKEDYGLGFGPLSPSDRRIIARRQKAEAKERKETARDFARVQRDAANQGLKKITEDGVKGLGFAHESAPGPELAAKRARAPRMAQPVPAGNQGQEDRLVERAEEGQSLIDLQGARDRHGENIRQENINKARSWDNARRAAAEKRQAEIMKNAKKPAKGGDDQAAAAVGGAMGHAVDATATASSDVSKLMAAVANHGNALEKLAQQGRGRSSRVDAVLSQSQALLQQVSGMRMRA